MNKKQALGINAPKRIRNHVNPLSDQREIIFGGFGNNKPIILDIGAYRGEFSQELVGLFGKAYNYLVCEIRTPFAEYLTDLFSEYDNVKVFDGDASRNIRGFLLPSLKKGSGVAYIFVNFPDPWFKTKHKKRRVLNNNFLTDLSDLLEHQSTDCSLIFQTDQLPLFEETIELIKEHPAMWKTDYITDPLWGIQSHWEKIKRKEGCTIYRAQITLQKTNRDSI